MVSKKWILVVCAVALVAIVCAVTYAEKGETKALPAAVKSAVNAAFPNAAIEKFGTEEAEIQVYEVELKDASMNIGADGTVATIETVEEESKLPAAVAQAIKEQGAKVVKVEKEVKKAELKLVPLGTPVTTYEAKINKDGKETEIVISADGKILEKKAAEKDEKDKD
jgi:uncharacterized protein (UPF0333 family)